MKRLVLLLLNLLMPMILEGSKKANKVANATLEQVRDAIGLNYFKNR